MSFQVQLLVVQDGRGEKVCFYLQEVAVVEDRTDLVGSMIHVGVNSPLMHEMNYHVGRIANLIVELDIESKANETKKLPHKRSCEKSSIGGHSDIR